MYWAFLAFTLICYVRAFSAQCDSDDDLDAVWVDRTDYHVHATDTYAVRLEFLRASPDTAAAQIHKPRSMEHLVGQVFRRHSKSEDDDVTIRGHVQS